MMLTDPSGVMVSDPVVSPPRLNQNPAATPRPSPGLTGDL